jgi:hypothetical protein
MHFNAIGEPGPVLQHRTELEGDNSVAPNIQEEEYYTEEAGQVPSIEACDVLLTRHCQSLDSAQAERLAGALHILEGLPPAERSAVAAFILDVTGANFPELPGFGGIRGQAELWADCANHLELECYTVAGLRRLGRVPLALPQRKRLFRALWLSFSDDDRRAFLTRVDPEGRLQGWGA